MSGDVQPRKRKDKRRRRDERKSDGDVTVLRQSSFQDEDESSHGVHITKMGNDDVHLHVHHDHGTGGHWCAKIIFFALMAILLGLVGLIIMENRGLEDLDTPLSESRFSNYFDGWVDEHRVEHEAHDVHEPSGEALDDHDEHDDHEEELLSEELEEEAHEEEEDEEEEAHEEEEEEGTPEEDEDEEDDEEQEEEEEEENNAGENITAEDADEEADDDEDEEEPTVEATTEATTETTAEYEANEEEEQDEDKSGADADADADDDDDEPAASTEAPLSAADEYENGDEDADEDQDVEESVEPAVVQSTAQSAPAIDDNDDEEDQYNKDADDDDDDDDFESLDQQFENEPAEKVDSQEREQEDRDEPKEEEPNEEGSSWLASLAVKFGVGVALALVSRLVLNRKSPNTTEDPPAPEAVMRRRLTIASAEDNIPDDVEELPPLDDEYSEEEIEIEEEIEVEISDIDENDEEEGPPHDSDDNVASMASYVPETFEQLSALYKAAKEPPKDSKPEEQEPAQANVQAGASDIYVEYEDSDEDEDDEEITDEEDEISDVDDADLMSRLDAKYGRLPVKECDSDPDSDDPSWTQIKPKEAPAVKEDPFEQELRKANEEMIRENYAQALRSFNTLTLNHADEPAAHLGKARVLAHQASQQRSNQRLWEAIDSYKRYLALGDLVTNDSEFLAAGETCIAHLRFMGHHHQAVAIHELLIERSPGEPRLRNQLSLTHLMANNLPQVEREALATLRRWPDDAVAQLHYGLALKQLHADYRQALPFLKYAVESEEEGTQEAFFYLALGESLQRLNRQVEALEVFRRGVAKGFYASQYQRSLYNEPGLRAQPFWQPQETGYRWQLEKLTIHWRAIREEALSLMGKSGYFEDEAEQLRHKGVWQQFELFAQGRRVGVNCRRAPFTCGLLEHFPESRDCRRGQVKFSVMHAQTHVWPHCGPTNCRLRAHLALVAPEPAKTVLRVADQERTWREGELFVFDDSFEHEVWHNGSLPRLVLILDMWHPDLTPLQRRSLPAI